MGGPPRNWEVKISPRNDGPAGGGAAIFSVVATLVATAFALTSQSLWIDEANSALKATQPSIASWWQVLVSEKGSDLQMPSYMFYLWCWEKLAGHSELVLRAANVPWFFIAQAGLFQAARRCKVNPVPLLALASINPFVWFYLNEARPYVMQYAGACLLCLVLASAAHDPPSGTKPAMIWIFVAGLLILCASSLLGVLWSAFAGLAWVYLIRRDFGDLLRAERLIPLAGCAFLLGLLGLYYVWTLNIGGRASSIGGTDFSNLAFVLYELLGASGLGPGRVPIREDGAGAFRELGAARLVLLVLGLALVLGLVVYALFQAWKRRSSRAVAAGVIYALPAMLLLFLFGYEQHFRVLGRHFTPLLPTILALLIFGFSAMRHTRVARLLFLALLAAWVVSSLELRFAPRHQKDDYRDAAAIAKSALSKNETVWWSADAAAAVYYRVPLGRPGQRNARLIIVPTHAYLKGLPTPDLVIASKPDIYDDFGSLADYLEAEKYTLVKKLPAFTVWQK